MSTPPSFTKLGHRLSWAELYPVMCLIILATSPAIFLGDGNRNLGLIAFMFLSPLFIAQRKMTMPGFLLLGFALSIVIFPAIFYAGSTRWSTVLYSLMFCALFLSYDRALRNGMPRLTVIIKIVRSLIIAYAAVLIIQQLCVLMGIPIFNLSNYDPSNRWKLNSLSAEPSHTARIMAVLMLCYNAGARLLIRIGENSVTSQRQNTLVWLCFFWTMITMISATAVIMLAIVMLSFIQRVNLRIFGIGFLLMGVVILLLPGELIERVLNLTTAFLTLDYTEVLLADHSGAMRVAPMLVLLERIEVFSVVGLFGNGSDTIGLFMSDYIWGIREGAAGGGLIALWYEYGFITFLLFVAFTMQATAAMKSPANFLIWLILIFIAGVNNQMVWLAIILLHSLNFYRRQADLAAKHVD